MSYPGKPSPGEASWAFRLERVPLARSSEDDKTAPWEEIDVHNARRQSAAGAAFKCRWGN